MKLVNFYTCVLSAISIIPIVSGEYNGSGDNDKTCDTDNPCSDRGTCATDFTGDEPTSYCICNPEYKAADLDDVACTLKIDDCIGNPCGFKTCTDGTRTDEKEQYICEDSCTDAGYVYDDESDSCVDKDECADEPCENGATCSTPEINSFKCGEYSGGEYICPFGFQGDTCSTVKDECAGIACQNGGSCQTNDNRYWCECSSDFKGDLCELPVINYETVSYTATLTEDLTETQRKAAEASILADLQEDDSSYVAANCPEVINLQLVCSLTKKETTERRKRRSLDCDAITNTINSIFTAININIADTETACDVITPTQDVNKCNNDSGVMCVGQATCVDQDDYEETNDNGFTCTCPDGFDGDLCGNNIDDCINDDCENNTCVDGIDTFLCQCNLAGPFFSGSKCQIDGCGDNGLWNSVDSVCDCNEGYSGQVCDIVDACINEDCGNSGSCTTVENEFKCTCDPGFIGDKCQYSADNIDNCLNIDCGVNGVCFGLEQSHECICNDGFAGYWCEYEDACETNTCNSENTQTCHVTNDDTYDCLCNVGFLGPNCEIDKLLCEAHGRFENDVCVCEKGYDGNQCSHCATDYELKDGVCASGWSVMASILVLSICALFW